MIRPANPLDYCEMDIVFRASVKALCSHAYDSAIIDAWAGETWPGRFAHNANSGDDLYVLLQGDRIVCFGAINAGKQLLESLFVHPDAAGNGIGQQLFEFLVEKAILGGVKTLHVVSSLNAARFYTKNGFTEIGRANFKSRTGAVLKSVQMIRVL